MYALADLLHRKVLMGTNRLRGSRFRGTRSFTIASISNSLRVDALAACYSDQCLGNSDSMGEVTLLAVLARYNADQVDLLAVVHGGTRLSGCSLSTNDGMVPPSTNGEDHRLTERISSLLLYDSLILAGNLHRLSLIEIQVGPEHSARNTPEPLIE